MYCELCQKNIEIVDIRHINVEHNITSKEYIKRFPDAYLEISDEIKRKNIAKFRQILKARQQKVDLFPGGLTIYSKIYTKNIYLRKAMYKVFGGKCFYTGQEIKFRDMHIDHIMPKSRGGMDCIANYVVSSSSFNKKKKDKILDNTDDLIEKNITTYSNLVLSKLVETLKLYNESLIPDMVIDR